MQKAVKWDFFSLKGLVGLSALIFLTIVLLLIITESSEAATITVDDDGPADHSKIQDAINASNPGDTIFIYNGIYYEEIYINKTLNLTGENTFDTRIIGNGSKYATIIIENTSYVNISSLNAVGEPASGFHYDLVLFSSSNCTIENNQLWGYDYGVIEFWNSSYNKLNGNVINGSAWGSNVLITASSSYNIISENWIFGSSWNASISIYEYLPGGICKFNEIILNNISFTYDGIVVNSNLNIITHNEISSNNCDIHIGGDFNLIYYNNF
ncbi:MAG: hypothetical protein JSV09_07655, partial [Thermoplasmata archaeon]